MQSTGHLLPLKFLCITIHTADDTCATQLERCLCFCHVRPLISLTRRGHFWHVEQEQPLREKSSGAAGLHHPLCCFLSDFPQHCQRRPDSPRGWNRSAGLHQTKVTTALNVKPNYRLNWLCLLLSFPYCSLTNKTHADGLHESFYLPKCHINVV